MAKVQIYTAYINPSSKTAFENPLLVREGLNWYAFFFTWIWAFYHRLWVPAVGGLLAILLLLIMEASLHPLSMTIIQLCLQFFFATEANDWRRKKLKQRGYILADIVTSDNEVGAKQRFFDRYFPSAKTPITKAPITKVVAV